MKDYTEKENRDNGQKNDYKLHNQFKPIQKIRDKSVQDDFLPIENDSIKNNKEFNPIDSNEPSRKSWNYKDTIEHQVVEELLKNQYQALLDSIKSYLRWYFKTMSHPTSRALIDPPPNYRKFIRIFEKSIKSVKHNYMFPNEWFFTKEITKTPEKEDNKTREFTKQQDKK